MSTDSPALPVPPFVVLAGPTAVGKSDVALLLAERLAGEIVSVDSMQVYRGLDIGTGKPSLEQRARAAHHLIDVVEVAEPFDAAQFARLARQAIVEIQDRGRLPILCGGTGLYFKACLEGLGASPPGDKSLRAQLEAAPLPELLLELAQRDPVAYERIDRANSRRVVRAVEVIRLTGKPFSEQRVPWNAEAATPGEQFRFGLVRSQAELHTRINLRVDEMFQRGLVSETEQLLQRGLAQNRSASQALGYRQVIEHLEGKRPLAETLELVKIRTRQFAKRQMTWFRKHARLTWLHPLPGEPAERIADRLIAMIRP
jgi:tRNA dimethylallyltransferase